MNFYYLIFIGIKKYSQHPWEVGNTAIISCLLFINQLLGRVPFSPFIEGVERIIFLTLIFQLMHGNQ